MGQVVFNFMRGMVTDFELEYVFAECYTRRILSIFWSNAAEHIKGFAKSADFHKNIVAI